jgi:hypothetical protein
MGFKRTDPRRILQRMSAGKAVGISTLLGISSLEGLAVTIWPLPAGWIASTLAAAAPLTVAALAAYVRGHFELLPPMLLDELSQDGLYATSPCSRQNLELSCEIVRPLFGSDHIDWTVLEHWRLRNPQGFMQIQNAQGDLAACFVIIGLHPSFFDQLIQGSVVEGQITSENVLSMRDSKRQSRIYISGVMVRDPGSFVGSKRARVMICCILKYIRHHFGLDKELYALALTPQSERLLKSLNFVLATPAERRRDKHNFYCLKLTKSAWSDIEHRIGDLSSCCKISYSSTDVRS